MSQDHRTLRVQGSEVPRLGFGTFQLPGPACREGVRDALEVGHRHIDTARGYENEAEVGAGIRDSGVAREDIFRTTKVPPEQAARDDVRLEIVPNASSHERRLENLAVFDFELSEDARARIAALPKDQRDVDPPWGPDWNV